MAYNPHYNINFKNVDECDIGIVIYEKDYGGSQETLQPSGGQPVTIDYKSGDFYANDPIRASTATIRFYNTSAFPMSIFASEDDTKYLAVISMNKPGGAVQE